MGFLAYHKSIQVIVEWQVPVFITEVIGMPILCNIRIGMEFKIESFRGQFFARDGNFTLGIEIGKDSPVFPQDIINISNIIISIPVYGIIVIIPALV